MTNEHTESAQSAALRALWSDFEPWLKAHRSATQSAKERFLEKEHTPNNQRKDVDKMFHQSHLDLVRKAWLERVHRRGLSASQWNLSKEDKKNLKDGLNWSPQETIQAEKSMRKSEEDSRDKGGKDKGKEKGDNENKKNKQQKPNNKDQDGNNDSGAHHDASRAPSAAYMVPLNYVAPQFGDPDYELLRDLGMSPFAVHVGENIIKEFYAQACGMTVLFHRHIATLPRAQAYLAQEEFDHRMKDFAARKRREWRQIIGNELSRRLTYPSLAAQHDGKGVKGAQHEGGKGGGGKGSNEPGKLKSMIERLVRQVKLVPSHWSSEEIPDTPYLMFHPSSEAGSHETLV